MLSASIQSSLSIYAQHIVEVRVRTGSEETFSSTKAKIASNATATTNVAMTSVLSQPWTLPVVSP